MKTATYKGRTYQLHWAGSTKYGRRAKLGFLDGSKEFWVDEARISNVSEGHKGGFRRAKDGTKRDQMGNRRCADCGQPIEDGVHARLAVGRYCFDCQP